MTEIRGNIEPGRGPLAGLKVIDLTRVLSGPFGTMWMASMGADIIKIENPKDPDVTRTHYPQFGQVSAYFATINRNKRCISLNLKAEEGKQIFLKLVKDADVLVENYRPGVMEKLGLGYDVLSELNPRLVYASISGYGTFGPYSKYPGYDCIAQGESGIMNVTGFPENPPTRIGSSFGDTTAGVSINVGILAALYCRNMTGKGQKVETSLVESLITLSAQENMRYFATGEDVTRMGNNYKSWHPYGIFQASDGYYVIGSGTQAQFELFAKTIGHPELIDDPRFTDNPHRIEHRQELTDIIFEWAKTKTVKEVCAILRTGGVPCGPVNSIKDLAEDEHFAGARGMFPILHQEGLGDLRVTKIPLHFSASGLAPMKPAGEIGAFNEEVYGELGISPEELTVLREKGII